LKPLFNEAAWLKADGVLSEILDGLYSDPPDENFYFYQLSALKEIKRDNLGIPLIRCTRGTNTVERTHKWMVPVFGNNPVGIELSDVLLSEMRHRMNMRAGIRNRPGYPRFGHYNTWTIDQLQNIYEVVFGILLYPRWLNGSNYERTLEKSGIVPLASVELRAEINKLVLPPTLKLTRDLQYLADRTGVQVPALPWRKDRRLLTQLVLETRGKVDPEKLCYDVLQHVDGIKVFPKLAVYNRRQLKVMDHTSRVRDATKNNQKALQRLDELNKQSLTESQSNEGEGDQGTDEVQDANGAAGEDDDIAADRFENAGVAEEGEIVGAVEPQENVRAPEVSIDGKKRRRRQRMVPQMPSHNAGINQSAFRPYHQLYFGTYPMHVELPVPDSQKRKGDKVQRKGRTCKTCGRSSFECNGAKTNVKEGESKACQFPPGSIS
jgi:hypothetical protein